MAARAAATRGGDDRKLAGMGAQMEVNTCTDAPPGVRTLHCRVPAHCGVRADAPGARDLPVSAYSVVETVRSVPRYERLSPRASAGSENSNCTVVPATLCTDSTGSNDVCVFIVSMHNNHE